MTARRRVRGFTLPELLAVVAIFTVFAGLALVSISRHRADADIDKFARSILNYVMYARRRAINTGVLYLVDVRADRVAYCELPWGMDPLPTRCDDGLILGAGTVCGIPGQPLHACETTLGRSGGATVWSILAGPEAAVAQFLAPPGSTPQVIGSGNVPIYLQRDGTCWSDFTALSPGGIYLFLAWSHDDPTDQTSHDKSKHRVIAIPGLGSKPYIVDHLASW